MEQFNKKLQKQFNKMQSLGKLFRVAMTGQQIWDLYLTSFEPEQDPIFRDPSSTVHNCNQCKNFIRRYGNIVAIDKDDKIITLFDFATEEEYTQTVKDLSTVIRSYPIENVFFETYDMLVNLPYETCTKTQETYKLGITKQVKRYTKEESELYGVVKPNEIRTFHHMHLDIDSNYVDVSGKSIEAIQSHYRDKYFVFKRGMEEIHLSTLELVKDLINQGSLLDGTAHLEVLEQFILHHKTYINIVKEGNNLDNWFWETSYTMSERLAKFKNTLLGVLCTELAEGEELNKACQSWNKRVDPANYMKVVAPITQKQINEAQKFVEENGYIESFNRRFATLDDIKVTEILHSNVGDGTIKEISMFDGVKAKKSQHKHNQFDNVEEVSIDKFMKDILPMCSSVEVYLKNNHDGNLVTLTTSNSEDSKPIFKWDNNYSWTFNGNLAGKSQIKEIVKAKGGAVDGVLRFSIMWAEDDGDNSDLDAHCYSPITHIYFSNSKSYQDGGNLDIDITNPHNQMPKGAVENITFPDLSKMVDGSYIFKVHQYSQNGSKGFKAEIEFDGQTYSYEFTNPVSQGKFVDVAVVTLKNGVFTIDHKLPQTTSTKEIYGLETNNFHRVNLVCLSPNHWGSNNIGNKHYFFMLNGAKTPTFIRSFHNENLIPELAEHRKVLEVLGATNMIESNSNQLTGLGFNSTVSDSLILKLSGSFKRVLKIKF